MDASSGIGDVIRIRHRSAVLADNPLGDPAERSVYVYLPPSYATASDRNYPVIFLLTGFLGSGAKTLNWQAFEPTMPERLDQLAAAQGENGEGIVVFPDCFTSYGGSQYINSSAVGRYGDYLDDELAPFIAERFRTLGDAGRGIAGHSSGGFGAIYRALQRPDRWRACASLRGDMAFALCYGKDFPAACAVIGNSGGLDAWLTAFRDKARKSGDDLMVLSIVAMAACYSPDPNANRAGIALPFDIDTCEILPDVWQRWLAFDPIQLVQDEATQQRLWNLAHLYLEGAMRDEYGLQFGARRLHRQLDALHIAHSYVEHDDTHSGNKDERYIEAFTTLIPALRSATP